MFTFVDLFAGIGGFHLACSQLGGKCVMASETDEYCKKTYLANHSTPMFVGDINSIPPADIPDHDILCAGFPCQPFSQVGLKNGFKDARGGLFFNIAEIINVKRPKAFVLENVRHLLAHNGGETFNKMISVIHDLGYIHFYAVLKASDYGLPQYRPRLVIVGFRDTSVNYKFPEKIPLQLDMSDILGGRCNRKIGFTIRVGGRGCAINDRRNWDRYMVDGNIRQLDVVEMMKMMGLPENFVFPVSKTQTMKQLGNSICIPVVKKVMENVISCIS